MCPGLAYGGHCVNVEGLGVEGREGRPARPGEPRGRPVLVSGQGCCARGCHQQPRGFRKRLFGGCLLTINSPFARDRQQKVGNTCLEERSEQEMMYSAIIFAREMLGIDGTKGKWREKQKGLNPQSWRTVAGEGLESGSLRNTENS